MDWLFEGLGTFVVGLILGGGAGSAVTWHVTVRKTRLTQRAGDHADQTIIGRDQYLKEEGGSNE